MDLAIQLISYLVGLPLELLTIAAMLRGGFRRYPFVFAYVVTYFLTTVAEMPTSVAYYWARHLYTPPNPHIDLAAENYTWWYWRDEVLLQFLVFAVVISLIYYATSRLGSRRLVRLGLIAGAVLFAGVSFLMHFRPHALGFVWATAWTRDLRLCAAVLDLALWAILIASREKDQRLLMLTCALGIMFAGEAVGESVRNLASTIESQRTGHQVANVGGVIVLLSDLAFLYIWWRAFRAQKAAAESHKTTEPPPKKRLSS